jgi:3-methyladenine DNA glycosylase AlkD
MAGIISDLHVLADPVKAKDSARFFKTGKGEYGEGDSFLGLTIPQIRKVISKYQGLSLNDLRKLLDSEYHEARTSAVIILVSQYRKADENKKEQIIKFYLQNSQKINNWDLVDISAPQILGDYFLNKDKTILYKFAKSDNLWQRRISVMATLGFIKKGEFKDTFQIAELLLSDKHDLIHKAVGWMLREVGKKERKEEENFLQKYYKVMPRTMLRYAIEQFPENLRQKYLLKVAP